MNLVIFGANGSTGRLLTKLALAEGHIITAFTRHPETFPFQEERLKVMRGNLMDLPSVEQAICGQDAVISTFGVPYSNKPIKAFSKGTAHIIQAMEHHQVRRLVCVSSSVMDARVRHNDTGGGFIFENIMKPFLIYIVGRTAYEDTQRMETLVMNSDLDWTIVRSSGLFETAEVTDYRVAETFVGRFTSRTDLADCMLRELTNNHYLRKTMMVATVSIQPNIFQLIWKEAFKN